MKTAYLVAPQDSLAGFIHAADRAYFAKPVLVEVLHTDDCGLVWVRDHVRGHTYPADKRNLKPAFRLTNKQRREMQGIKIDRAAS